MHLILKKLNEKKKKKNGLRSPSMYQYWLTSYDKCTLVIQDLNIRGNGVRGILEVFLLSLQLFHKPKTILK